MNQVITPTEESAGRVSNLRNLLNSLPEGISEKVLLDLYIQSTPETQMQIEEVLIGTIEEQLSSNNGKSLAVSAKQRIHSEENLQTLYKSLQEFPHIHAIDDDLVACFTPYFETCNMLCLIEGHGQVCPVLDLCLSRLKEVWYGHPRRSSDILTDDFLQLADTFFANCWAAVLKNDKLTSSEKVSVLLQQLEITPTWCLNSLLQPLMSALKVVDDPSWFLEGEFVHKWHEFHSTMQKKHHEIFISSSILEEEKYTVRCWYLEALMLVEGKNYIKEVINQDRSLTDIHIFHMRLANSRSTAQFSRDYKWILKKIDPRLTFLHADCYDGMLSLDIQNKKKCSNNAFQAFRCLPTLTRFLRYYHADHPPTSEKKLRLECVNFSVPEDIELSPALQGLLMFLNEEPEAAAVTFSRLTNKAWQEDTDHCLLLFMTLLWCICPGIEAYDETSEFLIRYFYGSDFNIFKKQNDLTLWNQPLSFLPQEIKCEISLFHWFDALQTCSLYPIDDSYIMGLLIKKLKKMLEKKWHIIFAHIKKVLPSASPIVFLHWMKQAESRPSEQEAMRTWLQHMVSQMHERGNLTLQDVDMLKNLEINDGMS